MLLGREREGTRPKRVGGGIKHVGWRAGNRLVAGDGERRDAAVGWWGRGRVQERGNARMTKNVCERCSV